MTLDRNKEWEFLKPNDKTLLNWYKMGKVQ